MDKVEKLEQYESIVFRLYNFLSQIRFAKIKMKYNNLFKRNNLLKDISSDTCIICGNGPSLKEFRFQKTLGIPLFCVNGFFKGELDDEISPQYYVMIDDTYENGKGLEEFMDAYNRYPNSKFIVKLALYRTLQKANINVERIYCIEMKLIQHKNYIKNDMAKNETACANVIITCIQCAMFMGYKNIYLIGCESNYLTSFSHFYDSEEENILPKWGTSLRWLHMAFQHYNALEAHAQKMKINIVNITPDSMIDAFKRMPLDLFYQTIYKC